MSFAGIVLGTILQLMLAFFLFMLVAVSGGGASGGGAPGKMEMDILNFSLYALPASCLVSAGIVFYLYLHGSGPSSYWWHGFPMFATALYVVYVLNLGSGT